MSKMFVLVVSDLTPAQQAVQSGHALAQFLIEHRDHHWNNQTLVYLVVNGDYELQLAKRRIDFNDYSFSCFWEPDLEGRMTAICSDAPASFFKNFKLMGG